MTSQPTKTKRSTFLKLGTLLAATAIAGCTGQGSAADRTAECTELRDHIGELETQRAARLGSHGVTLSAADLKQHARARSQALGDAFLEDCTSGRAARELDCSRNAETAAELAACRGETR